MRWLILLLLLAACSQQVVERGDLVLVTYTGSYENGTIFDSNNPAHQEALPDALATKFAPMAVQVGSGQLIRGFSEALVGMREGEEKQVLIRPQDAYGTYDPEKVVSVPGTLTFPAKATLVREQVRAREELPARLDLVPGETFETQHFRYEITNVSSENVTIYLTEALEDPVQIGDLPWKSTLEAESEEALVYRHEVESGDEFSLAYGPYAARVNETEITLVSELAAGMVVKGELGEGAVTEQRGGFLIDFNHPLAGRNLLFEIRVDAIDG